MDERGELEQAQYVRVEILEGFGPEDIADLVRARNTSNAVRDQSLMELGGSFDLLKASLSKTRYAKKVAYSEYEYMEDGSGEPKPIDVRDVIAILMVFDKDHFDEKTHPINSYRSKEACLKHFKANQASFKKIYPIAPDILALYDEIHIQLPKLYNAQPGKFGNLTGVATIKSGKPKPQLAFSGKEADYGVPEGFVFPMLGAFRALVEEKNGVYTWSKDPLDQLASQPLGTQLTAVIRGFALQHQNPSKTGKFENVWSACYDKGLITALRS
jgi:hypothetical protein